MAWGEKPWTHGRPDLVRPGALPGWAGAAALGGLAVAGALVALYGPDGSLSLIAGPSVATIVAFALAGLAVGVVGRNRRWWCTWGAGIAVAAALAVAGLSRWLSSDGLVNQHYPPSFLLWSWGALVAIGVAVTGTWDGTAAVRVVRVVTVPLALFACFLLINNHYGYWPTMGSLLGRPVAGQVSSQALAHALASHRVMTIGQFGPVSIPGPRGFQAGAAWVWLPPDFTQVGAAHVPVLVLLPGVPGQPYDWEQAGSVVSLADAYAQNHGGMAPAMVLVTGNGAAGRDTECVNGPQGNAEAYLAKSVPDFIIHHLGIHPDPARWGIVGFSEGGTCALGLATEHPGLYGRFVDIAGDKAPNFGPNAWTTLHYLYSGNIGAMLAHEPLWLMARHKYHHTEGWFAGSSQDRRDTAVARLLSNASRHAGMKVWDVSGSPGGHSWTYAATTLRSLYPALVASMPAPAAHRRGPSARIS